MFSLKDVIVRTALNKPLRRWLQAAPDKNAKRELKRVCADGSTRINGGNIDSGGHMQPCKEVHIYAHWIPRYNAQS